MLQTLVIILVLLWLLGMVSSYTIGGLLHILLVIALILIVVRLASGRSVV
ncbi:lmo0937 family membrane protein [Luteitalea sp.]|nr:lmo0937 family membrane protein [Luteitalea sp.]